MKSLLTCFALALAAFGLAQAPDAPKVTWELKLDKATAGAKVTGVVTVTIEEGLHAYQNPPTGQYQIPITLTTTSKGFKVMPKYPKGVEKMSMGEKTALYEGTIKIPVTVEMPKVAGAYTLKLDLNYQQCNDKACFPQGTISMTYKCNVRKPAAKTIKP